MDCQNRGNDNDSPNQEKLNRSLNNLIFFPNIIVFLYYFFLTFIDNPGNHE